MSDDDANPLDGAFDNSQMLPMAQGLRSFYDALVIVGFDHDSAMQFTLEFMREIQRGARS